jgi:Tol biopolymer transport system component
MPVVGGKPTQITSDKDEESRPLWHPDGQRIIYNVLRNDLDQINVVKVGGVPRQVTRGDDNYVLNDISDSGRLYYVNSETRSDIRLIWKASGRLRPPPIPPESGYADPDGRPFVNPTHCGTRTQDMQSAGIKSSDARKATRR